MRVIALLVVLLSLLDDLPSCEKQQVQASITKNWTLLAMPFPLCPLKPRPKINLLSFRVAPVRYCIITKRKETNIFIFIAEREGHDIKTNIGGKEAKVQVPEHGDGSLHGPVPCLGLDYILGAEQKNGSQISHLNACSGHRSKQKRQSRQP